MSVGLNAADGHGSQCKPVAADAIGLGQNASMPLAVEAHA